MKSVNIWWRYDLLNLATYLFDEPYNIMLYLYLLEVRIKQLPSMQLNVVLFDVVFYRAMH